MPPGTERHLAGAALALLADRVGAEGAEGLPGLTAELTRMLAGPYLGDRAAAADQWAIASAGIGRPKK